MLNFKIKTDNQHQTYLETSIYGKALLSISQLNKGTAFTYEERRQFNLLGKLPSQIETLDEQIQRVYLQYKSCPDLLAKNSYLNTILNHNQVMFYRLIKEHIEEMLPMIYTPVVGNAVQAFSKKYAGPRGLYINFQDQDHIEEILDNRTNPIVDLIVVSDGEGVLGIGDQGIGAMAIPVAKLMVYTAFAKINPLNTLPILLDAGTNNQELLNDPLYLGWRHPRVSGREYEIFIEKFVNALKKKMPQVFLHWEDFGRINAYRNLIEYRKTLCAFNDDIQGTGVVALATVLAAIRRTKSPLTEQRIMVFGAGSAGMGITYNIFKALVRSGLSETEARARIWLVDRQGLLTQDVADITDAQQAYLRASAEIADWKVNDPKNISLLEAVNHVRPTVLIGSSACPGAFTQEVVSAMAKHSPRPVILPLSNPTEKCEANPSDLIQWTDGQVICATGSPFEPVVYKEKTYPISQCNNYLSFPGIGLGVIAVKAKHLSNDMLWAATQTLSEFATLDSEHLLPTIAHAPAASKKIAIAVAKQAVLEGLANIETGESVENLVEQQLWEPEYLPYVRIEGLIELNDSK